MIGAEEKRKLMEQLGNDCPNAIGAVLKSLAGIMVLLIIAAGPWTFLSLGGHTASQESLAAMTERSKQALDTDRLDSGIERKRILDEQDTPKTDRALDRSARERMQDRSIIKAE
jgi:hypothetical protein